MNALQDLIRKFLSRYEKRREGMRAFLQDLGIRNLVSHFDIKEKQVLLFAPGRLQRHMLLLKKEELLKAFRREFSVSHITILTEEENDKRQ